MSDVNQFIRVDPEHGVVVTGKLTLCDAEGRPLCVLGSDSDGGFIYLLNKDGSRGVSAGCNIGAGFVDVHFTGERRLAVTLTSNEDGGVVEVTDKQGNIIAELPNATHENAGKESGN